MGSILHTKSCRLIFMMVLTGAFFLLEIVIGYVTNSLSLVADSFHMLSDVVALFVGFFSVRVSKWKTGRNTFGWARAEVMGALVNAVFLIALCFSIFVEALERIVEIQKGEGLVERPVLLLITGGCGLAVNLLGLLLFHNHAFHGHSHGISSEQKASRPNSHSHSHSHSHGNHHDGAAEEAASPKSSNQHGHLNMKGVFLHVLGDALGSVVVVASGLLVWLVSDDQQWKYYVDPAMSLVLIGIIFCTTLPLLRDSGLILLQTVPKHISVSELQQRLLDDVRGIVAIHKLHIWQLDGHQLIASAHITLCCHSFSDYMKIANDIREFFYEEGIYRLTVQPEFVENTQNAQALLRAEESGCLLENSLDCDGLLSSQPAQGAPESPESRAVDMSMSYSTPCIGLFCKASSLSQNADCCPAARPQSSPPNSRFRINSQ